MMFSTSSRSMILRNFIVIAIFFMSAWRFHHLYRNSVAPDKFPGHDVVAPNVIQINNDRHRNSTYNPPQARPFVPSPAQLLLKKWITDSEYMSTDRHESASANTSTRLATILPVHADTNTQTDSGALVYRNHKFPVNVTVPILSMHKWQSSCINKTVLECTSHSVSREQHRRSAVQRPNASTSVLRSVTLSESADPDTAVYQIVDHVLAWASDFDVDMNALFCCDELRSMPDSALQFIPSFQRIRAARAGTGGCLRYMQIEASLYKLSHAALNEVAIKHSRSGTWRVDALSSYKFESVPDYMRRVPWPFVSQEGIESIATFNYHGEGAAVSQAWSARDVRAGDVISVRGSGVSHQFWKTKRIGIEVKYIIIVQTEQEDVTPGEYYGMIKSDERVGAFFCINHDEEHAGSDPKFQAIPIGQLWKHKGRDLLIAHRTAAPWSDPKRANVVLWMLTMRAGERQNVLDILSRNLGSMLDKRDPDTNVLKIYAEVRFVVSPPGAGPDCHRTWEALAMGAIPIVRSHAGLYPLFAGQAVVIVEKWSDITRDFLNSWAPPTPRNVREGTMWLGSWWVNIEAARKRLINRTRY